MAVEQVDLGDVIRRAVDPLEIAQRVADEALAMIEPAEGVLVGLISDGRVLRYVCGAGTMAGNVGTRMALAGSLSGQAIHSGRTLVTHDAPDDPRVNEELTRAFAVRSAICVPLLHEGERLGILDVSSSQPHAFCPRDVALLSELADFIGAAIATAAAFRRVTSRLATAASTVGGAAEAFVGNVLDPGGAVIAAERAQVERVLRARSFTLVFQPIYGLDDHGLLGVEALARITAEPHAPPDVWLARAGRVGLGVELELALVEAATRHLDRLPRDAILSINAGPEVLATAEIAAVVAAADPGRVVVELTEQAAVHDYPQLSDAMLALRQQGVRLAIDDAGAGWASLMHILKLAPDFIKLDRQLTAGVDLDPVRRSLAASLALFAAETGAAIIAEGIETPAELATLRDLGIAYGQGYHLARPMSIEQLGALAGGRPPGIACDPAASLPPPA
jgi:EAL domain-containing protein (putative c-di-GMP-specific phosphodiesterase class I)